MNQADLLSCLRLDSFIAFDFETTGLQVETDRPIEVARSYSKMASHQIGIQH